MEEGTALKEIDKYDTPEGVFELLRGLRESIKEEARSYLKVGAYLYELRKNKRYKLLGSHIHNMSDLFKEEGLKRSHGNNYIRVYERFNEYLKDKNLNIQHRRLIDILNSYNMLDKSKIPELIESAAILSYQDFTDELNKAKGKISYLDCEHEDTTAHIKCNVCGKWLS